MAESGFKIWWAWIQGLCSYILLSLFFLSCTLEFLGPVPFPFINHFYLTYHEDICFLQHLSIYLFKKKKKWMTINIYMSRRDYPCLNPIPLKNILSSVGLNKMLLYFVGQGQLMNWSSVTTRIFSEILYTVAQNGYKLNIFPVNELSSVILLFHTHKGNFHHVYWVRTILPQNDRIPT